MELRTEKQVKNGLSSEKPPNVKDPLFAHCGIANSTERRLHDIEP